MTRQIRPHVTTVELPVRFVFSVRHKTQHQLAAAIRAAAQVLEDAWGSDRAGEDWAQVADGLLHHGELAVRRSHPRVLAVEPDDIPDGLWGDLVDDSPDGIKATVRVAIARGATSRFSEPQRRRSKRPRR